MENIEGVVVDEVSSYLKNKPKDLKEIIKLTLMTATYLHNL
jgi:hypothetical protein